MTRPLLLDLFCGAGGAAEGYWRAGFRIVGVDNKPQPHYPFRFVQADALAYLREHGHRFAAIHASPPCQQYSRTGRILEGKGLTNSHPALVSATRRLLARGGKPYVIENVPGAPLHSPTVLCGTMFNLRVYRHRLFESNIPLRPTARLHEPHRLTTGSHRGYSKDTPMITVGGNNYNREQGAAAMGVAWPTTRAELSQMIPPAYTHYIGLQIIRQC